MAQRGQSEGSTEPGDPESTFGVWAVLVFETIRTCIEYDNSPSGTLLFTLGLLIVGTQIIDALTKRK